MYKLILIILISPAFNFAQNTLGTQSQGIDFNSYPFGSIDEFDDRDRIEKGSPYLYEDRRDLAVITDSRDTILFKDSNLSTMNLDLKKEDGKHFFSSKYFNTFYNNSYFEDRYFIKKLVP